MNEVLHDACKPGGKMCFLCEQILTQSHARRGFLSVIRYEHPTAIQPGACLNCGHVKHAPDCDGLDYWGERCECEKFIRRTGRSGARAS